MPRSTNTHLHREHTELDEPQEQASEIDSIVQQQRSQDRDQDQTTTTQTLDRARERGRETRSKGERQQESKREGRRELCRQCTQREGCSQSDDGLMSALTGPSSRSSIPSFAASLSLLRSCRSLSWWCTSLDRPHRVDRLPHVPKVRAFDRP